MTESPEKIDLSSQDIKKLQIEKLTKLFPEAVTEGRIDFDKLKLTLGEQIETAKERYGMSWAGKSGCFRIIQEPSIGTLKPAREESVDFDTTENLFIEGDNLEVLKLLQKSYYEKVKMIYIDPPYNTGKDFVYNDKFGQELNEYLKLTGQADSEGKKLTTNTDSDGRYHSNWMNMMYPRLFLAKNLLRNDGVIFISIDDNEVTDLRKICDEIFGEENFIECITWNKRIPKNDKGIGSIHEYILVFAKNASLKHEFVMRKEGLDDIDELLQKLKSQKVGIIEAEEEIRKLYKKKGYDRGITLYNSLDKNYRLWGKINMSWPNANTFGPRYEVPHPKTGNPVKIPDRGWRWKKESFDEAAAIVDGKYTSVIELNDGTFLCGRIWFDKSETTQPSSVSYLDELNTLLLRSIISLKSDGGIELEKIFEGKSYFSYPKSTELMKLLIDSIGDANGIILDFFAGSGTTAHGVLDLNTEDGGKRKFICVQLPEPTEEDSEAFKAGYKNIAEIAKERIRRVIKMLNEAPEQKTLTDESKKQDLGFKVFKLDRSNFKIWDSKAQDVQTALTEHVEQIKASAKPEDLLYEILLKDGFELTLPIKKVNLADKEVYSIEDNQLLICLEDNLTPEVFKELKKLNPYRVVVLDKGFNNNDQLKTNAVQTLGKNDAEEFILRSI